MKGKDGLSEEFLNYLDMERKSLNLTCIYTKAELKIIGARIWLEEALNIVLSSAVEFSPPGRSITVALTNSDDRIKRQCKRRKSGVPDYALDQVFENFYYLTRVDTGK